jgi:hypothetical protein
MPWLLYGLTTATEAVPISLGVCDSPVRSQELLGFRVYWSELDNPEVCLGDAESLKKAALQFHQVLREVLAQVTPIPFRFPMLLEGEEALTQHLAAEQEAYRGALARVGDAVQYEIVGSWTADAEADLATPVSGREYLKRRQEAAGRITAIETKLKTVTGDVVSEWRTRQERRTHRWFALVSRANRDRFISSLRSAGPSEGVRLRLSGPWPPSEFIIAKANHG